MEIDVENKRPILSICIPTTNRAETLVNHLNILLSSKSKKFNVIVFDGKSTDGTESRVKQIKDSRLRFITNPSDNIGYQSQWFGALENADGVFAMHLNDRDMINIEELDRFLLFLEKHKTYTGGVCKYLDGLNRNIVCRSFEQSLMNVPYFAIHPTGIIIQVDAYKKIPDRFSMFLYETAGSHPHDIILGRLCTMGNLFIYTKEIWVMASNQFYKKNKSGVKYSTKKQWFEPEERLYELQCCIRELDKMNISPELYEKKKKQMILNYLYLSTAGYFGLLEDEAQTAHYGIRQRKFSLLSRLSKTKQIARLYGQQLEIKKSCSSQFLYRWALKRVIMVRMIQLAAPVRDNRFYKSLKSLYKKKHGKNSVALRY